MGAVRVLGLAIWQPEGREGDDKSLEEGFDNAYLVNDSPLFRRWKTSVEFHEQLRAAEIVIGVDEATGNEQIVYGVEVETRDSHRTRRLRVLSVPLSPTTSEPVFLTAAVHAAKGLPIPDEETP